jgi:hypothetical protein
MPSVPGRLQLSASSLPFQLLPYQLSFIQRPRRPLTFQSFPFETLCYESVDGSDCKLGGIRFGLAGTLTSVSTTFPVLCHYANDDEHNAEFSSKIHSHQRHLTSTTTTSPILHHHASNDDLYNAARLGSKHHGYQCYLSRVPKFYQNPADDASTQFGSGHYFHQCHLTPTFTTFPTLQHHASDVELAKSKFDNHNYQCHLDPIPTTYSKLYHHACDASNAQSGYKFGFHNYGPQRHLAPIPKFYPTTHHHANDASNTQSCYKFGSNDCGRQRHLAPISPTLCHRTRRNAVDAEYGLNRRSHQHPANHVAKTFSLRF